MPRHKKKKGIEGKKRGSISQEKDKIFLHAVVHDEEKFNYGKFLTIDLKKGQVSECPYALLAEQGLNSMVSIGSVIYVVGGIKPDGMKCNKRPPNSSSGNKKGIYHKGMSFLDLNSDSNPGWVEAPYFHDTPDCSPSVLAFAGKIYVFVNGDSQAGIFDPTSNSWETLLPPPDHSIFDIICTRSAVPDPVNNRILLDFGRMGCYYAYYPDERRWEKVVEFIPFFPKHVFADGVFYVYNPKMPDIVEAYDVSSKQWLNIEFTSEVHYRVWRYEFDDMFYLGNGLICLAGYSPNYDLPGTRTNLFIAKIRFHRSTARPTHLVATPFPLEIYTLDPPYSAIQSFLPI
ncbi:uncharacterized protein LOC141647624 [Silene latifolia]|uniref:uncharacterized protein LOC141647624 n=1 Tax=Silene latifolia TaxID=37657 RepID=UPI003D774FAF